MFQLLGFCEYPLHVRASGHMRACAGVAFYFFSITLFDNFDLVLDELLRIFKNPQQVHELLLIISVKFFRIIYSFLGISDVVFNNRCMNS